MQESPADSTEEYIADAKVSQRSSISIVWLIPVIALLIALFLLFKYYSEKGAEITIYFKAAQGITAGKTKVRYHDVDVGTVKAVTLPDLQRVAVTVEVEKSAEKYLNTRTSFWLEQPRLSATEISGLNTLLSGVFIGVEPVEGGEPTREFVALDGPPAVSIYEDGGYFNLHSETRGSLNIGSPVYYHGFRAGQVVDFRLTAQDKMVDIRIFIKAPYHEYVYRNTRFWNVSGVDMRFTAAGFALHSESLVSVLLGGLNFDLPTDEAPEDAADEQTFFRLYADREHAFRKDYRKRRLIMYFDGNVRGLQVGAPVELRGMPFGEVVNIHSRIRADDLSIRIPVTVDLEPDRLEIVGKFKGDLSQQGKQTWQALIDKGLRAQLKTGNLLTGALYVDLDFYPEEEPVQLVVEDGLYVLPTVPTKLEYLTNRLSSILDKIEKVPFDQIGSNLEGFSAQLNNQLTPEIIARIGELGKVLDVLEKVEYEKIGANLEGFSSQLNNDLTPEMNATMRELKKAARSLRILLDYLERHPEALISGKRRGN
ncbi:MAG: MlaD family protein [Chromatiales bacterium]|jgi:paraquat-inducible protein B